MKYTKYDSLDYPSLMKKHGMNSLLAKTVDYLNLNEQAIHDLNRMIFHPYDLFNEGEEVVDRIREAIENEEKICIYGDYDMDGILATTILVKTFEKLNVKVGYHIPHRFHDGYGLNVERVRQIANKGYTLIITVDNGIRAFDAIEEAAELGVDVIVTDHHEIGNDLPVAYAFLHTRLSPDYPFKEICGGMVAYKLSTKLLNKHDPYLFTLAACTTVSDMMPLVDENRAVVKKGLILMNQHHYPAFDYLVNDPSKPYTASTISFEIAPRINSIGRLPEEMNPNSCVQYFLLGEKPSPALKKFAIRCKEINSKRQSMTSQAYAALSKNIHEDDPFVFLYEEPVHEGLLGLIAGKITNEYHKVSFVMNYDEQNNLYKGSARGLPGFRLEAFLETASEDLIVYGGHDMAAGFSVRYDRIPSFYQKVKEAIEQTTFLEEETNYIEIESSDISIENINSLKILEPFGYSFEKPLYGISNVEILRKALLSDGKHLRLQCRKGNLVFNAIWFFYKKEIEVGQKVTLIGDLSVNQYKSMQNIQIILKEIL